MHVFQSGAGEKKVRIDRHGLVTCFHRVCLRFKEVPPLTIGGITGAVVVGGSRFVLSGSLGTGERRRVNPGNVRIDLMGCCLAALMLACMAGS